MEYCLLITIIIILLLFIDNCANKNKLSNINNDFIHGMWENEDEELYFYISKDKDKDGYNLGYIVKDTTYNEPIRIKYKVWNDKLIINDIKGTDYLNIGQEINFDIIKCTISINNIICTKDTKNI